MYDEYWDETSEYDEMILELKSSLRESVRQEIKDEIASLRKKLDELTDVQKNWSEKLRELEDEKFKYQEAARKAKSEANKTKLSELMESIEQEAWTLREQYEYILPKCDKCDKDRNRHFKSPLGKDMKEPCECAKRKYIYRVEPLKLFEIHQRVESNGKPDDAWLYYALYSSAGFFRGDVDEDIKLVNIRAGEKEHKDPYNSVFFNKDDAQEYAEELNAETRTKNG